MDLVPFSSLLLGNTVGTPAMRAVWSEQRMVESWMEVERAIVRVQARLGLIPREAADAIDKCLNQNCVPLDLVTRHAERSGHLFVAFLRAFREVCGEAAEHFHVGPTTQDILDSGLVLQMREAEADVQETARALLGLLCRRAIEEKGTAMPGRTHEQHALPTTFGLVLAGWALEIRDGLERMRQAEARWQVGSLAGGVGAQSAFVELAGVEKAFRLQEGVCSELGLALPLAPMHGRIDRFAEAVQNLGLLCATLARIGLHLRTLERPEVAEVSMPYGEEACSSSTMPNKRNPEAIERIDGLARMVQSYGSALPALRMADHRDSTRIPVLYTAVPGAYLMTACALSTLLRHVSELRVERERMLANLNHPAVLGQTAAERLMIRLYRKTGRKQWAHTQLSACARVSREQKRHLREVIEASAALAGHFSPAELDECFDLGTYLGTAPTQAETAATAVLDFLGAGGRTGTS